VVMSLGLIIDLDAKLVHRSERHLSQHPNVVHRDNRLYLVFPTSVRTTPNLVAESATKQAERGFQHNSFYRTEPQLYSTNCAITRPSSSSSFSASRNACILLGTIERRCSMAKRRKFVSTND